MTMKILVTGGAGYIGSHCCKRLLELGHTVVVIDNLDRGNAQAIDRLRTIPGVTDARLAFVEGGVGNPKLLAKVFGAHKIDAVMHFAALAYVRESMDRPLDYYRNNSAASTNLIAAVDEAQVPRFVFSSTCATYGEPSANLIPITEDCPQSPINPYGWSKLFIERILRDSQHALERAGKPLPSIAMLRYFNVAGCDRSGLIGEDHKPETHLIPIICQVALGQRDKLSIFGDEYNTPDGTCVRDYIHVEDLVEAHIIALDALQPGDCRAYNLGLGRGISILEIVESVRRVTGKPIPTEVAPGHPGDPPTLFCDASKITRELGWKPQITDLDEIIGSAWNWLQAHPDGY